MPFFPDPNFLFGNLGMFGTMPTDYGVPGQARRDEEDDLRKLLAAAEAAGQGYGNYSSAGEVGPPKSAMGGWRGFQAKMGLDDPRVRARLAQSIASSPNLQSAIGAIAGSQALAADYDSQDEEDRQRRERFDMERERFELEKRENQRRQEEIDRAAELRRRQERDRDQANVGRIVEKREYLRDVARLESEGKIDPGLARIYRRMDPSEGDERIRSRFYPTDRERLDDEARRSLIGTRESLSEARRNPPPRADNRERLQVKDQIQTVNATIDDVRAELTALRGENQFLRTPEQEKRISELEEELSINFSKRRELLGRQEGAPAAGPAQAAASAGAEESFHEGTLVSLLQGVYKNPDDAVTQLVKDGKFEAVKRLIQAGMKPKDAIDQVYGRR